MTDESNDAVPYERQSIWLDAVASYLADNANICAGGRGDRWAEIRRSLSASMSRTGVLMIPRKRPPGLRADDV